MSVAEANAIIVSRQVQRKVQALFDLPPRGEVQLKGKQNPTPTFQVTGIRAVPEPLRGLKGMHSPLVGRTAEWERLQAALEQLPQNRGQIVAVMGEAGLGKSRLVAEMQRFTAENPHLSGAHWFEGRCLSYTESVSYWPFQDMLRQALGLSADEDSSVALAKLREALIYFMSPDEAWDSLPYIANFLNLELDKEFQEKIRYLDAEGLQRRTYLALRSLMAAQAHTAPTIMVLDDLHWLDNASFRLLEYLLPQVNQLPIMFVLIFRPERTKICWQIHERASRDFDYCYTPIALTHLPTEATRQLLENLVGISQWPESVRQLIFSRTEGNPLYLEEVLRSLINEKVLVRDNGGWQLVGDVTAVTVPDTLQGVMMARLDRLQEPSRRTAQVASVIGRSFPYDIITHVATNSLNQSPTPHLVQLQQYEIVEETQRSPELVYSFQHTLMQEVCYRSLATRSRRRYHQQIAHYLEANQSQNLSEARGLLPLIAHHAFEGQDWATALRYEILSGQQAQKLFANDEALDHFRKALRCTTQVTTITMRESLQVIHAAMGELLVVTSQYEEAQSHLEEAYALAQKRQDAEAQATACRWLARSFELRGDYAAAFAWIDTGLAALAGQQTAESAQLLLIAGLIHTRQGDSEKGLAFALNASQIAHQVQELAALARANNLMGHILRARGERGTAVSHFQEALTLYQQVGDINGQATALNQIAVSYLNSDWPQAEQYFREARLMYDQMGDIYHRVFAENNLAEVLLKRGAVAEAIQTYETALGSMEQIGGSAYVLGALHNNLGSSYVQQGNVAMARQHLQESRDLFEKAQARDFLPELHRHLAEAALLTADLTEATTQAEMALALARELEMPTEEACSLRVLGKAMGRQGATAVAQQHLQASIDILANKAEEEYELARSRLVLAQLYMETGQIEDAQKIADECLAVFSRLAAMGDVTAVHALQQKIAS
jgi:predicted ATPase